MPCMENQPQEHTEMYSQRSRFGEVAAQMSELIAEHGIQPPDLIQPGPGGTTAEFFWEEAKLVVIVDLDDDVSESAIQGLPLAAAA